LVCGSHTQGATRQLEPVLSTWGEPVTVDTELVFADIAAASDAVAISALSQLSERRLAIIMSERTRSSEHNTLEHGRRVMEALTTAVHMLAPEVEAVIAKGGITSADVARTGLGTRTARVLGQVLPGISAWKFQAFDGHEIRYGVVSRNVGSSDTLTNVLLAVGFPAVSDPAVASTV
jgi:uncharacterized protein YgbK (DUF1537 family)